MRAALIVIASCLLAACQTTKDADTKAKSIWIGKSADGFFIDNGPPISQYKTGDGQTVSIWTSGRNTISIPTTSTATTYLPNGQIATTTVPGANMDVTMECQLKIVSSREGKITDISVYRDTAGAWDLSRCAEMMRDVSGPAS